MSWGCPPPCAEIVCLWSIVPSISDPVILGTVKLVRESNEPLHEQPEPTLYAKAKGGPPVTYPAC